MIETEREREREKGKQQERNLPRDSSAETMVRGKKATKMIITNMIL